MTPIQTRHRTAARQLARTLAGAALLGGLLVACDVDKALEVESPSRIPAGGLENPANATLLVNGAISDFDCAFQSYVVVSGLIGEELDDYTQTADRWPYDRRDVQPNQSRYAVNSCVGIGAYAPLQTARVSANNIKRMLQGWTDAEVPGRQLLLGKAAAYEGWSQLLLAEGFCSMVFSILEGTEFAYGPEITRQQALQTAEATLTEALTALQGQTGAEADAIRNFVLVGRARARLDQGNTAGARADAILVPASFVFNSTASGVSARRNNRVYSESNDLGVSSVVGTTFRTLNDPRVPVLYLNRSNALGVQAWAQRKYTTAASSIPIATGLEAQLIVAEVDRTTNPTAVVATINTFRTAGNQGPYTGPTDPASLLAQIIDQRARALWLTGTHLGDLIRYDIDPRPTTGTAYPAGGTYGDQLCMPLPDVERMNNPLLSGG